MASTRDVLTAARAEALFVSALSAQAYPSVGEVAEAIRHAVRTYGGVRGCAGEVAAAYGDHPELAVPRMRWARRTVEAVYAGRRAAAPAARVPAPAGLARAA